LQDVFPEELALLSRLFTPEAVDERLRRLNHVFRYTERKWLEYVQRIPERLVRYLLIAEAPPQSDNDPPPYFLDPAADPRTLMKAVATAFFGAGSWSDGQILHKLAEQGFLMVDSVPFAVNYSLNNRRSRPAYCQLIAKTARSYMLPRLNTAGLFWAEDLRIAFSVRRNALCILSSLQDVLRLGDRNFELSENMIATNASHYPGAEELRRIFGLGSDGLADRARARYRVAAPNSKLNPGAGVADLPIDDRLSHFGRFFRGLEEQFQQRCRARLRNACISAFQDIKATGASETQVRQQAGDLLKDADVAHAFESVFGGESHPTEDPWMGRPSCPKCKQNSTVVPIYYGRLLHDNLEESAFTTVRQLYALLHLDEVTARERFYDFVAGGCCLRAEKWFCRTCNLRFVDDDYHANY
jgi:hypothetical protein